MRFNFLHSPWRSSINRLREIELDPRARRAFFAFCGIFILLLGSAGIERLRLSHAQAFERERVEHWQDDERAMAGMRAAAETLDELSALSQSIRAIQSSGEHEAVELAEIGDSLPEQAWLTSIRQDGDIVVITGGAQSYAIVAETMRRLGRTHMLHSPALISSQTPDDLHPREVTYELHLQERAL
jgi:Tfp pilus assembly protein PilN